MQTTREVKSQDVNLDLEQHAVRDRYLVFRFLLAAGRRYAWRWLKNCIKVLTGREITFDESGLFLRQYVLHLTGLRTIRKITCTGLRGEGAGSQALMVMNAINFARAFGLIYAHSPFTIIQHTDRPMEEWVEAWEALFNLGAGEAVCDVHRLDAVNFSYNFNDLDRCFGWRSRGDELAYRFKAMIPEFRRKYYLNKSPRETVEVTVAVHMRRGYDVSPNDDLFTSTGSILRTIKLVRGVLDSHSIRHKISVYSEGNAADWADIPELGLSKYRVGRYLDGSNGITDLSRPVAESVLDIDAFRAMHELIEADVLITAKSCFSYCAGLISDGIKISETRSTSADDLPGWRWLDLCPPESWLMSQADGSFDTVAFECQLSALIHSKGMAVTNALTSNFDQKSIDLK